MNIEQQSIKFWSQKAESFMSQKAQGKISLSVADVASLFMKEGVYIDNQIIEKVAGDDKQVDKNKLAMLFYMLDGTKKYDVNDKSQYWIEHDNFIESNGTKQNKYTEFDIGENNALKNTLANTSTPEEFEEIKKAFGVQGKPQFGLNSEEQNTNVADKKVGILSTIRDEDYQAKLDSDVDKILNGKPSIKLSEFQKTQMFSTIQKHFMSNGRMNYMDVVTKDEQYEGDGIIQEKDIEISRDELKTLFMVADANLVKVNGEEKFVFDSDYSASEKSGLIEITQEEIEQIYMIMGLRSYAGADAVNTFIENNS